MKGKEKSHVGWLSPFHVGLFLSLVATACVVWFLATGCFGESCQTRWAFLMSSTPNVLGDTIAGLVGASALLWIIITAWNQSIELRTQQDLIAEQSDEMKKQAAASVEMAEAMRAQQDLISEQIEEMKKQATASTAMAEAMHEQKEFYSNEKAQRESEKFVDEALTIVRSKLPCGDDYKPISWIINPTNGEQGRVFFRYDNSAKELAHMADCNDAEFFNRYYGAVKKHCLDELDKALKSMGETAGKDFPFKMTGEQVLLDIKSFLDLILEKMPQLSEARQMVLEGCRIPELAKLVGTLIERSSVAKSDRL